MDREIAVTVWVHSLVLSARDASASHSMLVAPSTCPTTLYRLEKKVTQSFKTPFSLSLRSSQLGRASSGLVDVLPRALEASLPAKTVARQ